MNFVANGHQNARDALEPIIRAEIEQVFADEWNKSGLFRRWLLQRQMNIEVERRIENAAPGRALY